LVKESAALSLASEPEGAKAGVPSRSAERGHRRIRRMVAEPIARIAKLILD